MSNVIKVENVIYDKGCVKLLKERPTPKPLIIPSENKDSIKEAEALKKKKEEEIALERAKLQSAVETESSKFKKAVRVSSEILERGNIEAKLAFEKGKQEGIKKAFDDAQKLGSIEGRKIAEDELKKVIDGTLRNIDSINSEIGTTNKAIKTDCINFAFGLAENILGIHINHEKQVYNDLTSNFLAADKENVTMTINGTPYVIETLQTQALLKAVDGLQGIFASINQESEPSVIENIEEDGKEKIAKESETNKKITENSVEKKDSSLKVEDTDTDIEESKEGKENSVLNESNPSDSYEKVKVTPFIPEELKEETLSEKAENPEQHKRKVSKFNFENFDSNDDENNVFMGALSHNDKALTEESDADFEKDDDPENSVSIEKDNFNENNDADEMDNQEKFVFINPINKKSKLSSDASKGITLEDLALYDKDDLKAILKKLDPNDLATSLSKASERVVKALTDTLTRKNRDKVLEAIKYLGPVSESEVSKATKKITDAAKEI